METLTYVSLRLAVYSSATFMLSILLLALSNFFYLIFFLTTFIQQWLILKQKGLFRCGIKYPDRYIRS